MSESIFDVVNHVVAAAQRVQNAMGQLNVRSLIVATDVVHLTGPAALEYFPDCFAMIDDVNPVSDIEPITIERDFSILNEISDKERDDFLRVLIRPKVVGAPSGDHIHSVGVVGRPNQEVASGFTCGVGTVWGNGARLLEADICGL